MVWFIRLFLGLLLAIASAMALSLASAAAQQASCADYSSAAAAQFALDINPGLGSALDPDGNGVACDHEGAGGLQLPGTQAQTQTPASNVPAEVTVDAIDQQPADTTTMATATQPATTQQAGALDGRLGGNQAAFAAAHGEPVEVIPSESNDAVVLRAYTPPPTAFDLYTVDLNDQVAIVVVVAETSWDSQQAADIIANYLPPDVTELSDVEPLADDSLLISVFSEDLAAGISAETMTQAGIPGVPGDLYLLLFPDEANGIVEMEIGLGNGDDLREESQTPGPVSEPTATQPASGPGLMPTQTPASQTDLNTASNPAAFLTETRAEVDRLQGELDELRAIIAAGTFTDAEIDRLSAIIGNWVALDTGLPAAPPEHSAMAQQLQQVRTDLSAVGLNLLLLISAPDSVDIDETVQLLDSAERTLDTLDQQLTALGV